jgi:hypothetical protein
MLLFYVVLPFLLAYALLLVALHGLPKALRWYGRRQAVAGYAERERRNVFPRRGR